MATERSKTGPPAGITLDEVRTRHGQLLEEGAETVPDMDEYRGRVRRFVFEVVQNGVYFDEPTERRALQAYVDHWARDLESQEAGQERANLTRLEIRPFSEDALRQLQDAFSNPFGTLSKEWASVPPEATRSPTSVLRLLEDKCRSAGLRFQDGFLREISAQVSNDLEGGTLAEFCLWQLFEDPQTRVGNKIRRPKGEVAFSCTAYLRDKATTLHQAQAVAQRQMLMKTLGLFDDRSTLRVGHRRLPRTRLPHDVTGGFKLYAQGDLKLEAFLLRSRLVFPDGETLLLVHQSLLRQWVDLAVEITRKRERVRILWWVGGVTAVAVGTMVGAWLGIQVLDQHWTQRAMKETSDAFNQGGSARSIVKRYQAVYERAWYRSDDQYREMVGEAIFEAGREYHLSQISHSLEALRNANTPYVRNVVNDALGAAIGYLTRAGALGSLPPYPARPRKCKPGSSDYCVTIGADTYPFSFPKAASGATLFSFDFQGKQLAAAWKEPSGVRLMVYRLPEAGKKGGQVISRLAPAQTFVLDPLQCPTMDAAPRLRFSPDGGVVTLECLDDPGEARKTEDGVEWKHTELRSGVLPKGLQQTLGFLESQTRDIMERRAAPEETLKCTLSVGTDSSDEVLRLDQVDSVYFGGTSRNRPITGFVTTGPDGYVRLWRDPPIKPKAGSNARPSALCPRAQFFSDFVRVSLQGRPTALAFQETPSANYYAVYHDDPPVIRVFEQRDPRHAEMIMEHYPAAGLGRIVDMRFTTGSRCIEVRMARSKPLVRGNLQPEVLLQYNLILEKSVLQQVGKALRDDLGRLNLREAHASEQPYKHVPAYWEALKKCESVAAEER